MIIPRITTPAIFQTYGAPIRSDAAGAAVQGFLVSTRKTFGTLSLGTKAYFFKGVWTSVSA